MQQPAPASFKGLVRAPDNGGGEASCAYSPEVQAMLQPEPGTLELFARMDARLAGMADAEPMPADWTPSWSWKRGEEWQGFPWEQEARRREEIAPTIDHRRVVTLFDAYGNERVITQPLPQSERFDPATIVDPRKRANFEKWLKRHVDVKRTRATIRWMEFACRVTDEELEKDKPKKGRAPKKIENDPVKAK